MMNDREVADEVYKAKRQALHGLLRQVENEITWLDDAHEKTCPVTVGTTFFDDNFRKQKMLARVEKVLKFLPETNSWLLSVSVYNRVDDECGDICVWRNADYDYDQNLKRIIHVRNA